MWAPVLPLYQSKYSVICVMYWGLCKMFFEGKFFLGQGRKRIENQYLLKSLRRIINWVSGKLIPRLQYLLAL